jgi:hypothetical protein
VPVSEAVKPPIGVQVRITNAVAQNGRLKIRRGSKLALELTRPTWVGGIVGGEIDEHGKHSDLVPSLRYACIAAQPYLPDVPTPETDEQREARERHELAERAQRNRRAVEGTKDYEPEEFQGLDLFDDM